MTSTEEEAAAQTTALLHETRRVVDKLYDAESMMNLSHSIANGFVVLLGGSTNEQQQSSDKALSFLALTQGNVLDACFGVTNASARGRSNTPASQASERAKELLTEAGTIADSFPNTAVETYHKAFTVVETYRRTYDNMNCFVRCFKAKKLRQSTEVELQRTFSRLAKSVAESTATSTNTSSTRS